jgi:hypothetical protein
MSADNPHFGHVDDAAYKIPDLIKQLGDVGFGVQLDQDRIDMVDAIAQHAHNVQELLLDGLQSIGHVMSLSGCGDFEVGDLHVMQLGVLVKHLANEANFLRVTHGDMQHILSEQAALKASKDAVRRRASNKNAAEGRA